MKKLIKRILKEEVFDDTLELSAQSKKLLSLVNVLVKTNQLKNSQSPTTDNDYIMTFTKFIQGTTTIPQDVKLSLVLIKYNKSDFSNIDNWVIPKTYEVTVKNYSSYETYEMDEDCNEHGVGETTDEVCECIKGSIWDDDNDEFRKCDDSELESLDECDCTEFDYKQYTGYYWPIEEHHYLSTENPEEIINTYNYTLHDVEENMGIYTELSTDFSAFETDPVEEYEFDYSLEADLYEEEGDAVVVHQSNDVINDSIGFLNTYTQK